jgi:hypothetical protein
VIKPTPTQPHLDFNLDPVGVKIPGGPRLEFCFDQPELSSDGGLLLAACDPKTHAFIERLAACVRRGRRQSTHSNVAVLGQRVLQIVSGRYDTNDADTLRHDPVFQAALGKQPGLDAALASQPTLSRLENEVTRTDLMRLFYAFIDEFMDSYEGKAPRMIVLDLDPTAVVVYGQQELGFYNGHVGDHCLMPFHLYEGISGRLITTVLRTGKTPSDKEIIALLKRVVRRIRQRWPRIRICLRADGHHSKPEVLDWCENEGLDYIIGYAPNPALEKQFASTILSARKRYQQHKDQGFPEREVRLYASGWHLGGSWNGKARRVVMRVLCGPNGLDARFIVSSFYQTAAKALYEGVYCGRGQAELYIRAHKLELGGDRLSCEKAEANQMRLFLHSAAYVIMDEFRRRLLAGTELARATFGRIRLELLKVAVRLDVLKDRVRVHLSWRLPALQSFLGVLAKLGARIAGSQVRSAAT